ncbi:Mating type a1 protein [Lachancea thermotolerans]
MDSRGLIISLESIKKVCLMLLEPNYKSRQEVCDKIYENYATLLQDAVVESKEKPRSGQQRRTLLSKDTRLFLESVFEKKRSPNSRERKAIADKCGLTPIYISFSVFSSSLGHGSQQKTSPTYSPTFLMFFMLWSNFRTFNTP